jgi:hypothetical protein
MPIISGQIMNVVPGDDHLLRRIAKAVVWQWEELPAEVQKLIHEQAVYMWDSDEAISLNEQLSNFIEKNKGKKA